MDKTGTASNFLRFRNCSLSPFCPSLYLIGGVAGAVCAIEAYGVRKAQCVGTIGLVFLIRSADAGDHVKAAAVEEQIDHQAIAVNAVHSSHPFEPCMSGFRLPGLIRNPSASAFDRKKVSKDGVSAGFDA